MARDRRSHGSKKEVQDASSGAVSAGHEGTGQQREQFLALIRALAREAARTDHEDSLASEPDQQNLPE